MLRPEGLDRLPKIRSQIGFLAGLGFSLASLVVPPKPAAILATGVAPRSWSPLHSLFAPWYREFRLGRFTNGLLANGLELLS